MPVSSENGGNRLAEDTLRPGQAACVGKWGSQCMVVREEDWLDFEFFFRNKTKEGDILAGRLQSQGSSVCVIWH